MLHYKMWKKFEGVNTCARRTLCPYKTFICLSVNHKLIVVNTKTVYSGRTLLSSSEFILTSSCPDCRYGNTLMRTRVVSVLLTASLQRLEEVGKRAGGNGPSSGASADPGCL